MNTLEDLRDALQAHVATLNATFDTTRVTRIQEALKSWSGAHRHARPFIYVPQPASSPGGLDWRDEIAAVATWAALNGWSVRPIGKHATGTRPNIQREDPLHNWSPLHLATDGQATTPGDAAPIPPDTPVLYISFGALSGVEALDETAHTVRVLPGTRMFELLHFLRVPSPGHRLWLPGADTTGIGAKAWTLPTTTAPGVVSVGGVLAIGGHGTRLSPRDPAAIAAHEDPHVWPGSLSGTLLQATTLAWVGGRFLPRTFTRADPELAAIAVSLGRAVLLDATLAIAPDYPLRTIVRKVKVADLYGQDTSAPDALSSIVRRCVGAETLSFRPAGGAVDTFVVTWERVPGGTAHPWPQGPTALGSLTEVSQFLEGFADISSWRLVANLAFQRAEAVANAQSATPPAPTPAGHARTYVSSATYEVEPFSYALVLPEARLQEAVSAFYDMATSTIPASVDAAKHHMALEVRVTDLDDVGCDGRGATVPLLSVCAPPIPTSPEKHVVLWMSVLSAQNPASQRARGPYFRGLEAWLVAWSEARGFTLRPEWSKGWAYTRDGAWTSPQIRDVPQRGWGPRVAQAAALFDGLDPVGTFKSPFHVRLGL